MKAGILDPVAMANWVDHQTAEQEVGGPNPSIPPMLKHVGKVTGNYAGIIHWQRCRTRDESQGMYITYASAKFE